MQIGPVKVALAPDGLFDINNTLELSVGYADSLEHMFKGDITGVEASFPSGGVPSMTLVAHDFMHRMTEGSRRLRREPLRLMPLIGRFCETGDRCRWCREGED